MKRSKINQDRKPIKRLKYAEPITTETEYNTALEYLAEQDTKLAPIIDKCRQNHKSMYDFSKPWKAVSVFDSLIRAIISQQLSTKASETILNRFIALFGSFPTASDVLDKPVEELRSAGLSARKVEYIRDLAMRLNDGVINNDKLVSMSDEEVSQVLKQIKGIGQWSCDMFLMFQLRRPNVLPTADLGVKRGFKIHFGSSNKLPTVKKTIIHYCISVSV